MRDFRATIRARLTALAEAPEAEMAALARGTFAPDCRLDLSAPFAAFDGPEAIVAGYLRPLRAALRGARRRELLFLGGESAVDGGGLWVAALLHHVGEFSAPLAGVAPSGRLAFLRAGEFWRIEGERITAGRVILDLPDLARRGGGLADRLGAEITFPAPATQDGLLPRGDGATSLAVIERLIATLHAYDPATFDSRGQTGPGGVWADDMMWYGPAGIGSNTGWQGFLRDHRAPFLRAFPDRRGGDHYARFGDGAYAAMSGWPSMTMTHAGEYLGVPATGRALRLRVMDFYRIAEDRIAENWVMLDLVDLAAQMGVDLLDRELLAREAGG